MIEMSSRSLVKLEASEFEMYKSKFLKQKSDPVDKSILLQNALKFNES